MSKKTPQQKKDREKRSKEKVLKRREKTRKMVKAQKELESLQKLLEPKGETIIHDTTTDFTLFDELKSTSTT